MSRVISDILGAPEPHFSHTIKAWEAVTGNTGHDVRLISDIAQARKKVLSELQLDHADTHPKELYFALRHKAVETNQALAKKIGITEADTTEVLVQKIIGFVDALPLGRDVWTIKHAVIKQLLKKHVPKKTLKALGLRSIDSVLKRNNACELLTIAYQIESSEWTKKVHAAMKKMNPTDFQSSRSDIFNVSTARAERLRKSQHQASRVVLSSPETGSVLVVQPQQRFKLDVITITLALLETLYELRVYSAYFRLVSVNGHFGDQLHEVLHTGLGSKIDTNTIGWKVLQRYFNHDIQAFEQIEQPHLQTEDMVLFAPLSTLAQIVPDFVFWKDHAHVFMAGPDRPVSVHLFDVATNASNDLPFERSVYVQLQQRLQEELSLRYLQHAVIRQQALRRFEAVLQ